MPSQKANQFPYSVGPSDCSLGDLPCGANEAGVADGSLVDDIQSMLLPGSGFGRRGPQGLGDPSPVASG